MTTAHEIDDEDEHFDDDDARDEVSRLIRGRGLRIAVEAAISVAGDKNAPAPARATASGLLLRAAGMLERPAADEATTPIAEMTPAQLQKAMAHARRVRERAEAYLARVTREESDDGIFG